MNGTVLQQPAQNLSQGKNCRKNADAHRQKKLPGDVICQLSKLKRQKKPKAFQVKGFDGFDQLFIYTQYEGHGSPGHTRNHIGCPHTDTFQRQNHIIGERS